MPMMHHLIQGISLFLVNLNQQVSHPWIRSAEQIHGLETKVETMLVSSNPRTYDSLSL